MYIAVYGTLKKGYGANHMLRGARYMGTGKVHKYALYGWGLIPYAFYTGNQRDYVAVEVYDLRSKRVLRDLDQYEAAYQRKTVRVKMDESNKWVKADMWIINTPSKKKFYTYEDYLDWERRNSERAWKSKKYNKKKYNRAKSKQELSRDAIEYWDKQEEQWYDWGPPPNKDYSPMKKEFEREGYDDWRYLPDKP